MIIIRLIACADCIYVVRVTDKLIISKPQAHTLALGMYSYCQSHSKYDNNCVCTCSVHLGTSCTHVNIMCA